MHAPTLLILAAGMGSRYGGLKQLDPMGPDGETMLDYAVRDARAAGFGKVVFVIRRDFEIAFREQVGSRAQELLPVDYAFQEMHDLPAPFTAPDGRTKPWGTAHAVLAARDMIQEPFAVINADDYYGAAAYKVMGEHLRAIEAPAELAIAMLGYSLEKTLSPHGSVNRGICKVENGHLRGVEEFVNICRNADGFIEGDSMSGERRRLSGGNVVSMNFWGFSVTIFSELEAHFAAFLKERGRELKSECYLPAVVDALLAHNCAVCLVLPCDSPWFGVTYPEDKARVVEALSRL